MGHRRYRLDTRFHEGARLSSTTTQRLTDRTEHVCIYMYLDEAPLTSSRVESSRAIEQASGVDVVYRCKLNLKGTFETIFNSTF